MATYSELLKKPQWQRRRLEILQRDDFSCKYCGAKDLELHIHHLKYIGKPWEAQDEDLISCCNLCHKLITKVSADINGVIIHEIIRLNNDCARVLLCNHGLLLVSFENDTIVHSKGFGVEVLKDILESFKKYYE